MATLLALFFTCPGLIAQRPTALTLQYELARHCVSADVFDDAHVEIDAQAMNSRWPWFVIAFSHATGTGLLADELHLRTFDRSRVSGGRPYSVRRFTPPVLLVFGGDLRIQKRMNGPLQLVLSDGRSVYLDSVGTTLRLYSPQQAVSLQQVTAGSVGPRRTQ